MLHSTDAAAGQFGQAARVGSLVAESLKKKAVDEGTLLNENPLTPADMSVALKFIQANQDYSSYHLLLAVRRYHPASYKKIPSTQKAAVLCSALKHLHYLNDWGYLAPKQPHDGESATALLEEKQAAISALVPLLGDDNPAPLFGSQESTMSNKFKYRRKDFAFRYIVLLLGETPEFAPDPPERDKSIEGLKIRLKKLNK
jgi:hypothetical protein